MLTASMLYAECQGRKCVGRWACHWCGGPCNDATMHDDLPEMPGTKRNKYLALCPANPWMCEGCRLWRRTRLGVTYLLGQGPGLDGQTPKEHSWLITPTSAQAVHPAGGQELLEILLDPPERFALLLLSVPRIEGDDRKPLPFENRLHLGIANDVPGLKANELVRFTLDNTVHTYSVYDLKEALKFGPEGKEPGVRALFHLFRFPVTPPEKEEPKTTGGRPPALKTAKQTSAEVVRKAS